MANINTE